MARLFHWVMAGAMFVLLVTAFFPIVGIQFAWVTWHWIAGLVLTGAIIYHIIHVTFLAGLLVDLGGSRGLSPSSRRRCFVRPGMRSPVPSPRNIRLGTDCTTWCS